MDEKKGKNNEIDLDLINKIFKFFIKNVIWIIVLAIVFGCASFVLTKKFVPEKYISQLKLYVSANYISEDIASASTEYTYTKSVVETYNAILMTNDYFDIVCENVDGITRADVINSVAISVIKDTNLLRLTVTTQEPEMSLAIAEAIEQTSGQYINDIEENAIIKVVETPEKPTAPSSPNVLMYTLLGAVVGIFAGITIGLIRQFADTKIRSEIQLKERYDLPILSSIPQFTKD